MKKALIIIALILSGCASAGQLTTCTLDNVTIIEGPQVAITEAMRNAGLDECEGAAGCADIKNNTIYVATDSWIASKERILDHEIGHLCGERHPK